MDTKRKVMVEQFKRREKKLRFKMLNVPLRTGMIVDFEKPQWVRSGSWLRQKKPLLITGVIVADSYSGPKHLAGQHTFTIIDAEEQRHFIKGRNLYPTARVAVDPETNKVVWFGDERLAGGRDEKGND